jgi:hypothetical protein
VTTTTTTTIIIIIIIIIAVTIMENKNGKIGSKRDTSRPTVRTEDVTATRHS